MGALQGSKSQRGNVMSVDQQVQAPYGFDLGDSISTVYTFTEQGTKLGLPLHRIQELIAVELSIESGELALPWSEDEIEQGCWGYGPTIEDVQKLLETHPEFLPIACGWAYGKSYQMFYMLHEYRTDGIK